MPPNRKTDIALQDFASLDVAHLQQTLKTTAATSSSAPANPAVAATSQDASASYWDWPADAEIEELQCLDTSHIERNIVKEARRLAQRSATVVRRSSQASVSESDAYWNMPAEKPAWFDVQGPTAVHHPAPKEFVDDAEDYWNESPTAATTNSDDYWAM